MPIQGILAMLKWRRNGHALTMTEVFDFTGWLPYRTREEFVQHRADHPELEPFPPYNFDDSDRVHDQEAEDEGGSLHGCSFCRSDYDFYGSI